MSRPLQNQDVFVSELFDESDRGCVLVGAAHVEAILEELIRRFCRSVNGAQKSLKPLFKGHGAPLGSCKARIQFASAFGLIDATVEKGLNQIRKMRKQVSDIENAMKWDEKEQHIFLKLAKRAYNEAVLRKDEADHFLEKSGIDDLAACREKKHFVKAVILIGTILLNHNRNQLLVSPSLVLAPLKSAPKDACKRRARIRSAAGNSHETAKSLV